VSTSNEGPGGPPDAAHISTLVEEWAKTRAADPRRATVLDLYRFAAGQCGVTPQELSVSERRDLARAAMTHVWPAFEMTSTSERDDQLQLCGYAADWPDHYTKWRAKITSALGDTARRIEHVGSTSVPGMCAKPIIDIQISVDSLADEEQYVPALAKIGAQLRSRDDLHRYFRPFVGQPREFHIHVCEVGSGWERDHLLFRDYLRTHSDARDAYARAKQAALRDWPDDWWGYTDAKTDVIVTILERAQRWADTSGWRL